MSTDGREDPETARALRKVLVLIETCRRNEAAKIERLGVAGAYAPIAETRGRLIEEIEKQARRALGWAQ